MLGRAARADEKTAWGEKKDFEDVNNFIFACLKFKTRIKSEVFHLLWMLQRKEMNLSQKEAAVTVYGFLKHHGDTLHPFVLTDLSPASRFSTVYPVVRVLERTECATKTTLQDGNVPTLCSHNNRVR